MCGVIDDRVRVDNQIINKCNMYKLYSTHVFNNDLSAPWCTPLHHALTSGKQHYGREAVRGVARLT